MAVPSLTVTSLAVNSLPVLTVTVRGLVAVVATFVDQLAVVVRPGLVGPILVRPLCHTMGSGAPWKKGVAPVRRGRGRRAGQPAWPPSANPPCRHPSNPCDEWDF